MSICSRCGAGFGCGMVDGSDAPCWCTRLPPVVPVPAATATSPSASASAQAAGEAAATGCWCPACLEDHIVQVARA